MHLGNVQNTNRMLFFDSNLIKINRVGAVGYT